jgi:hypothetical protein
VLKPWLKQEWCIPPQANAAFVAQMEDVLEVYTRSYDPRFAQICLDETSHQLLADARDALLPTPGTPARQDSEYVRHGYVRHGYVRHSVANLFLACEPLVGWRHVTVTQRRTQTDFAHVIADLVDVRSPDAERIVLVLDNLNIHAPASLYVAFPPAEARRLVERLEIHYTPKHGSWLDMAEIELSALSRQCLDRRLPDHHTVQREVAAGEAERNAAQVTIQWRFTTDDARIKLHHLYPSILA